MLNHAHYTPVINKLVFTQLVYTGNDENIKSI